MGQPFLNTKVTKITKENHHKTFLLFPFVYFVSLVVRIFLLTDPGQEIQHDGIEFL